MVVRVGFKPLLIHLPRCSVHRAWTITRYGSSNSNCNTFKHSANSSCNSNSNSNSNMYNSNSNIHNSTLVVLVTGRCPGVVENIWGRKCMNKIDVGVEVGVGEAMSMAVTEWMKMYSGSVRVAMLFFRTWIVCRFMSWNALTRTSNLMTLNPSFQGADLSECKFDLEYLENH